MLGSHFGDGWRTDKLWQLLALPRRQSRIWSDYLVSATAEETHLEIILQPLTTAVVRRGRESLKLPRAQSRSMSTVAISLLFAREYIKWENWTFWHVVSDVLWPSNCFDRMAFRRQESCVIPRDREKQLHGSSDLFRSQKLKGCCCAKR